MYVCMYVPVCRVVASYSETTHQCVNTYTRTVLVFTSVLSAEKLSLKVLNYDVISWFTPAKNLSRSSMLTCCLLMLLSHIVVNVSWLVIRPTWFLLHMAHLSPYYRVHTCQCHCLAVVGKSQIESFPQISNHLGKWFKSSCQISNLKSLKNFKSQISKLQISNQISNLC